VPGLEVSSKPQLPLAYPDYQWSARDAWKCVGMLLLIGFVTTAGVLSLDKTVAHFRAWRLSGWGYCLRSLLLHYGLYLLIAAYFARTENFHSFFRGFGLDRKPSASAWFGIAMALVIRIFGHLVLVNRWSRGVSNYDISAFRSTVGMARYLYLLPLLAFAPFFEETIYRGFLYKAFRNSYPLWASVALLVAWAAFTHWSYYSVSWVAAVDLSALTIVQCYLREKSDIIWDCILCHMAFNASLLFVGHPFQ
jgi:membrane protease YdiL (CAAX protease family)